MAFSPMMMHYLSVKEEYKDAILMYRLGDFYEMFFDDAKKASEILGLVLTARDCGDNKRAPMCGVPYHAVDTYIAKLIDHGLKVAVCEQLTEPKPGKIVERGVVRVITPGTVVETEILDEKKNNFICSIIVEGMYAGLAFADVSTGDFFAYELEEPALTSKINDVLAMFSPAEIITDSQSMFISSAIPAIKSGVALLSKYSDNAFEHKRAYNTLINHYGINSTQSFGIDKSSVCISASGALISYINETQKRRLTHLKPIRLLTTNEFMTIDANTRKNLELQQAGREGKRKGSLVWLLDNTRTAMGARLLSSWIERPLQNIDEISERHQAVDAITEDYVLKETLDKLLYAVKDIERISTKISYNTLSPRDCNALEISLAKLPEIKQALLGAKSSLLNRLGANIDDLSKPQQMLMNAIEENAPALIRDGGYIKRGYNKTLDELYALSKNSKQMIATLEEKERERTGIKNLKVGFNKIFGYYFEITNSYKHLVPLDFIRKQTLVNCERFVSPELKSLEEAILTADEKALALEKELFNEIREELLKYIPSIQKAASAVAAADVLLSFAKISQKSNYNMPIMTCSDSPLVIKEGRHPIVECSIKKGYFIPNDTYIDCGAQRTMIITGPNMAGKSTYMRQVALIVLMAHIGCFVPAQQAFIPLTDRIFTRVGASDDIAFNQSTFMVEMTEVANILNNATSSSLVILDEVGRGTATFDGLSIAWAVLEYITCAVCSKTLFATHFHELTQLEGKVDGIVNYKVDVKELEDGIVFLHKISRGEADKSFGIEVAALAGLPKVVLNRAKEVAFTLEQNNIAPNNAAIKTSANTAAYSETDKFIGKINIDMISPLQAFDILKDLIAKVKKNEQN